MIVKAFDIKENIIFFIELYVLIISPPMLYYYNIYKNKEKPELYQIFLIKTFSYIFS